MSELPTTTTITTSTDSRDENTTANATSSLDHASSLDCEGQSARTEGRVKRPKSKESELAPKKRRVVVGSVNIVCCGCVNVPQQRNLLKSYLIDVVLSGTEDLVR